MVKYTKAPALLYNSNLPPSEASIGRIGEGSIAGGDPAISSWRSDDGPPEALQKSSTNS